LVVDEVFLETLIPSGAALDSLAREHDRRGTYADYEVCLRVAAETLIARLRDGFLKAWAPNCSIDSSHDTGAPRPGMIISQSDFYRSSKPSPVPIQFWLHYHDAGENYRAFDPVSGDFRFTYSDCEYSLREGAAYGVHFERQGLPPLAVPPPEWIASFVPLDGKVQSESEPLPISNATSKGRKPANWWPAFAEELAAYIHDTGLPVGDGRDGQTEVIDTIFARMVEQGKPEPSRTQVQPVINAVLTRLRSAGN
jgi:hypothetical protein